MMSFDFWQSMTFDVSFDIKRMGSIWCSKLTYFTATSSYVDSNPRRAIMFRFELILLRKDLNTVILLQLRVK